MSIRALRTLLAIERHGSFAAAAAAVGLTQSAVSLQVKGLEAELRTSLFERGGGRPVLSADGRAVAVRARQVVALYDDLANAASSAGELAGTLRLGAIPTMLTGSLPAVLAALARDHPRLQVRLVAGLSADLAARVAAQELDAALVTEPAAPPAEGLVVETFAREPFVVLAPAGMPGRGDRALLEAAPFIRFDRRAWAGRLIDGELRRRGIAVTEAMELDSLEAMAQMVAAGLGVAVVPVRAGAQPFGPALRAVPFGEPPLFRAVALVRRRDSPRVEATRALLARLSA